MGTWETCDGPGRAGCRHRLRMDGVSELHDLARHACDHHRGGSGAIELGGSQVDPRHPCEAVPPRPAPLRHLEPDARSRRAAGCDAGRRASRRAVPWAAARSDPARLEPRARVRHRPAPPGPTLLQCCPPGSWNGGRVAGSEVEPAAMAASPAAPPFRLDNGGDVPHRAAKVHARQGVRKAQIGRRSERSESAGGRVGSASVSQEPAAAVGCRRGAV